MLAKALKYKWAGQKRDAAKANRAPFAAHAKRNQTVAVGEATQVNATDSAIRAKSWSCSLLGVALLERKVLIPNSAPEVPKHFVVMRQIGQSLLIFAVGLGREC